MNPIKESTPETANLPGRELIKEHKYITHVKHLSSSSKPPLRIRVDSVCKTSRARILASGSWSKERLSITSPINVESGGLDTEQVIDRLFPGNPLLCVGQMKNVFNTKEREQWRGKLAERQFIVPSPMSALKGVKVDGKPSPKTNDNTGPRRFLVVEQDKIDGVVIPEGEQVGVITHLASLAPLVMVVFSGGKSLHAWFFCEGRTEEQSREFMEYCVSLGADRATWTKSQFVRMPGGVRENGSRQQIIYFNPTLIP